MIKVLEIVLGTTCLIRLHPLKLKWLVIVVSFGTEKDKHGFADLCYFMYSAYTK